MSGTELDVDNVGAAELEAVVGLRVGLRFVGRAVVVVGSLGCVVLDFGAELLASSDADEPVAVPGIEEDVLPSSLAVPAVPAVGEPLVAPGWVLLAEPPVEGAPEDGDEEDEEDEDDESSSPGSAHATAGTATIAEPMPSATASAPMRPTYLADPITAVLFCRTRHGAAPGGGTARSRPNIASRSSVAPAVTGLGITW
jgi:hypothetical protein